MPGIDLTIRMANLQNAVDRLSVLRERYRNLSADIEVLRQRQLQLQAQGEKEAKQLQRVTKLIRDKTAQQNALNVSMNQAENSTKRATAQIQKMGFAAKTATTLVNQLRFALVGTFGVFAAIQVFKNLAREAILFEDTMKQVKVVSGATAEEMKKLRDIALEVAVSGIFSPSEIAKTQVQLAKLGFTASEVSKMIESISKLSIITGEDAEKSTNLLATTLRSFGYSASQTERVANAMAKGFNSSALGVENMYEAMKYVGPVARQLGWTFEDVTSILAALSDNMISGSLAGTSLRNIMLQWADENSNLRKEMNVTGYTFNDFIAGIQNLDGMSIDAALNTIELRRAVTAFLTVVQQSDKIRGFNAELNNMNNAIDKLADERLDTVSSQWRKMITTIQAGFNDGSTGAGAVALRILKNTNEYLDEQNILKKYQIQLAEEYGRATFTYYSQDAQLRQILIDRGKELLAIDEARIRRVNELQAAMDRRNDKALGLANTEEKLRELQKRTLYEIMQLERQNTAESMQLVSEKSLLLKRIEQEILKLQQGEVPSLENQMSLWGIEEQIEIELARAKFVGFELDKQLELIRNKYQRLNNDLIEDQKEHDLAVRLEAITHSNKMEELQRKEDKRVADALKSLGDANKIKQQITAIQAEMEQAIIAGEPDRVAELSMRLNELQQMFDRIAKATEAYIYASKSRSEQIKIEAKETMKLMEEASKGWTPKKLAGDFEEDGEDGYVNSLKSLMTEAAQQANSLADDMVSAIDRVVDRYDRMVSDIQHALDRETELMAEGYANNVSLKQQELARIQALRVDALADQERYLAQQRVIESISQGLNIASAISSIIKDSFKNAGIWGTLVAPAVIGAMFSLWRANKVKAVESGYTYGEGGRVTGYIEGKPHSKGGKWINVEGKEYVTQTDSVNKETLPMLDYINKYGRVNWEYIGGIENKGVSIVSLDEGKTIKSIHSLLQKMGTESAQVEYHNGFRIHKSGSRIRKVYVN